MTVKIKIIRNKTTNSDHYPRAGGIIGSNFTRKRTTRTTKSLEDSAALRGSRVKMACHTYFINLGGAESIFDRSNPQDIKNTDTRIPQEIFLTKTTKNL